jgi:transposase
MKAKRYHQMAKATSGENDMNAIETLVAKDMANKLGPHEFEILLTALQEVVDGEYAFEDREDIDAAFVWDETPQGQDFWWRYAHIQAGNE